MKRLKQFTKVSKKHIFENENDYINCSGIYHLYYMNTVVYVGITRVSLTDRLLDHLCQRKRFHYVSLFDCKRYHPNGMDDLEGEEIDHIRKYRPFYNIIYNSGKLKRKETPDEIDLFNRASKESEYIAMLMVTEDKEERNEIKTKGRKLWEFDYENNKFLNEV